MIRGCEPIRSGCHSDDEHACLQKRKKGTSEIYAMKVMRKDKIMEKNHAEYMKAERDIWTKIEHPFVVQLRYSFQVLNFECVITVFNCLSLYGDLSFVM